jgi:hypothetical protein
MLRPASLLVDTNLLVLFVVGTASRDYISKHKRLKAFVPEDYDTLLNIIENATEVLVTPNILTETSNLAGYISDPARREILFVLQKLACSSREAYIPSQTAAQRREFLHLGLTDSSIIEACSNGATLLTTDLDLYLAVLATGAQAINYHHLRDID